MSWRDMRLLRQFRKFCLDKYRPAKRTPIRLVRLPEPLVKTWQMEDVVTRKWADIVLFVDGF